MPSFWIHVSFEKFAEWCWEATLVLSFSGGMSMKYASDIVIFCMEASWWDWWDRKIISTLINKPRFYDSLKLCSLWKFC